VDVKKLSWTLKGPGKCYGNIYLQMKILAIFRGGVFDRY